jgi:hypothetical protein
VHSVLIEHDPKKPAYARAPRYRLQIPLRYRSTGDEEWRDGYTENISRSGVLFRTDRLMPSHARVEMMLALPAEVGGDAAATVICRGRIVRTELRAGDAGNDAGPVVAATIAGYRIAHSSDPRRI